MSERATVVLVHGAWHGAWCWDEVVSRLAAEGIDVVAVDLPSVTAGGDLYDDAATVREAIATAGGDTVVVGHSYGGIVITEAAAGLAGVRHLVYLTAFMLDEGETLLATVGGERPPWIELTPDGEAMVANEGERVFYNTSPEDATSDALARLRPHSRVSFEQPVRSVAWRDVPSTYVICDQDQAIPVPAQEAMSAHAGVTHRLASDHSPFLTDPDAVADLIRAVVP